MNFPPVRIILVRPRNPGNIGACARAMHNFGFSELVVVDPYGPVWEETRAAPDAESVVRAARVTETLKEALQGCQTIWGTSSFAHRTLEQAIVPLPLLGEALSRVSPKRRIALVFGSERSGLSNDELSQCETILQIPMAHKGVSMNLAQAVAVVLYEWRRVENAKAVSQDLTSGVPQELTEEWIRLATLTRYPSGYTDAARAGRIRRSMQSITLGPEATRFLKSFSRWLSKNFIKLSKEMKESL